MKKLKFITLILTIALVAVSCETYDDYDTNRETVVGFTKSSQNINGIPEGGEKSVTLDVFASDLSNNDRTFTVISIPIANPEVDIPTADENYTFDTSVIIPANERMGSITVTGVDVSITNERSFFMLAIKGTENNVSGGQIKIGLKN